MTLLNAYKMSILRHKDFHYVGRIRHIAVRVFYIRELVQNKEIEISWIPSTENIADIFTKPLARTLFNELKKRFILPCL